MFEIVHGRQNGKRPGILFCLCVLALIIVTAGCSFGGSSNSPSATKQATSTSQPVYNPTGLLHVQGAQIIDAVGHPIILRGSEVDSSLIYIKGWDQGKRATDLPNSTIFHTMAQDWKMNVVRIPVSNWLYAKDTAEYTNQVDQQVNAANAVGLYVVLALHDDVKSGSPYGKNATFPKTEDITFWKAMATHYKNNPMVLFDLYNEPKITSWDEWLHGGGTSNGATEVGFQDMVDAVRSVGAQQIIVVEPGSAGGGGNSEEGGWATIGNHTINDPDIMYSLHNYQGITKSPQQLDAKWGPILNHYPIYYGEWAFLPNVSTTDTAARCQGFSHDQAPQIVSSFLNYMQSRQANWTEWQFAPHILVQDYTGFAPTSLDGTWTCGDPSAVNAGIGAIIKQYLTANHG